MKLLHNTIAIVHILLLVFKDGDVIVLLRTDAARKCCECCEGTWRSY